MKEETIEQRRQAAEFFEQRTVFDWVSDRSERDISYAIPGLVDALHDEDIIVRKNALGAISAALGDRQDVQCAIPAMLDILIKKEHPELIAGAAHFIKNVADQGIDIAPYASTLMSLLREDGADDAILGAADALAIHFIKMKAWEDLCLLLGHKNKDVRQEAAGTLHHMWVHDFQPNIKHALEKMLADPDVELQLVSARTLAPSIQSASDTTNILDVTFRYIEHSEDRIKNHALVTAGSILIAAVRCNGTFDKKALSSISRVIGTFEDLLEKGPVSIQEFVARYLMIYWVHVR
nr:hypothetical protein [Candidatus Sigynarchaeota archaeon]